MATNARKTTQYHPHGENKIKGCSTQPELHTDTDCTNPENKQVDSIICNLCLKQESENFCLDCKQYLCSACQLAHQRGTATKDHRLVRVEDLFLNSVDKPVLTEAQTKAENSFSGAATDKIKSENAVYIEQIDIGTKTDKGRTVISAIEFLEDGGLLVCDVGNKKVKLFDSDHEVLSEISLTSQPMGMALLTSEDAIVSLPQEKSLQKIKIKKRCILSLDQKLKTKLMYYRLLKYKDQIVAYAKDDLYRFFNIIDMEGNTVRCIMNEPRESGGIFSNVYYMSLSADSQSLYVTDEEQGCVRLSLNGKVNFTYKEPGTKTHHGVCAGPDNSIYIACNDSNKVVVLDETGKKMKDLISVKGMKPTYIVYNETRRKLLVKRGGPSKVLIYSINV